MSPQNDRYFPPISPSADKNAALRQRLWPKTRGGKNKNWRHAKAGRLSFEALEARELLAADLSLLNNNLANAFAGFQTKLNDSVFQHPQALIGSQLADPANPVSQFATDVSSKLDNGAFVFTADSTRNSVKQKLVAALGPLVVDGVNGITLESSNGGNTVRYVTTLQGNSTTTVDLDLALPEDAFLQPKLGLEDQVQVTVDWTWQVSFGVDTTGFFFDTAFLPNDGAELTIDVQAMLNDDFAAQGIVGVFAADLTQQAGENNKSQFHAAYSADIVDSNSDGVLRVGELPTATITAVLAPNVDAATAELEPRAIVNLQMHGAFFPSVSSSTNSLINLTVDADIQVTYADNAVPVVTFKHITLDLGAFYNDVFKPIILNVQDTLDPIKPIVNFLVNPTPLISDVVPGDVNAFDLARAAALAKFATSDAKDKAAELKKDREKIAMNEERVTLIKGLLDFNPNEPLAGSEDLGEFEAKAGKLPEIKNPRKPTAESGFKRVATFGIAFPLFSDAENLYKLLVGDTSPELFTLDLAVDFDFVFEYVYPVFPGLLNAKLALNLGATVGMGFGYDSRGVADFTQSLNFSNVESLRTSSGQHESLLLNGFYVDDHNEPQVVMDENGNEMMVVGRDNGSHDAPEATLTAALSAGASLNINLGAVKITPSVTGKFQANIFFDLNDLPEPLDDGTYPLDPQDYEYDGRVRIGELEKIAAVDPFALFNTSGELVVGLSASIKAKVDTGLFKVTLFNKKFKLFQAVIFQFDIYQLSDQEIVTGEQERPVKLGEIDADGKLTLYMGNDSKTGGSKRQRSNANRTGNDGFKDEAYYVSSLGPTDPNNPDGGETLQVVFTKAVEDDEPRSHSVSQVFKNVNSVFANGGDGNDVIIVDRSVAAGVELHGGSGNDLLSYEGAGAAMLFGDSGDDQLSGSAGSDFLDGGADNDELFGNAGSDTLIGGAGNDTLDGGLGSDSLTGGDGDDMFIWNVGAGSDSFLEAAGLNSGHDQLLIGGGATTVYEQDGIKVTAVMEANDTIEIKPSNPADPRSPVTIITLTGSIQFDHIEDLSIAAGGGSDFITVHNLGNTTLNSVALDLASQTDDYAAQGDTVLYLGGTASNTFELVARQGSSVHTDAAGAAIDATEPILQLTDRTTRPVASGPGNNTPFELFIRNSTPGTDLLRIRGGASADRFAILADLSGTRVDDLIDVALEGGGEVDTFDVVYGDVAIDGGGGANAGGDVVHIHDPMPNSATAITLDSSQVNVVRNSRARTIELSRIKNVTLDLGPVDNDVTLVGTTSNLNWVINGSGNTGSTDVLTVDGTFATNGLQLTMSNIAGINQIAGLSNTLISYAGIEELRLGLSASADDVTIRNRELSTHTVIQGRGGSDRLVIEVPDDVAAQAYRSLTADVETVRLQGNPTNWLVADGPNIAVSANQQEIFHLGDPANTTLEIAGTAANTSLSVTNNSSDRQTVEIQDDTVQLEHGTVVVIAPANSFLPNDPAITSVSPLLANDKLFTLQGGSHVATYTQTATGLQRAAETSIAQYLPQITLTPTTGGTPIAFGDGVEVSGDFAFVVDPQWKDASGKEHGRVDVYQRGDSGWKFFQSIEGKNTARMGFIAAEGNTLAIADKYRSGGDREEIAIFNFDGNQWLEVQRFKRPEGTNNIWSLELGTAGEVDVLAIGVGSVADSGDTKKVVVYERPHNVLGATFINKTDAFRPSVPPGNNAGSFTPLAIAIDNGMLAVGYTAPPDQGPTEGRCGNDGCGLVAVYKRQNGGWEFVAKVESPSLLDTQQYRQGGAFGFNVAMANGTLAISDARPGDDATKTNYVWLYDANQLGPEVNAPTFEIVQSNSGLGGTYLALREDGARLAVVNDLASGDGELRLYDLLTSGQWQLVQSGPFGVGEQAMSLDDVRFDNNVNHRVQFDADTVIVGGNGSGFARIFATSELVESLQASGDDVYFVRPAFATVSHYRRSSNGQLVSVQDRQFAPDAELQLTKAGGDLYLSEWNPNTGRAAVSVVDRNDLNSTQPMLGFDIGSVPAALAMSSSGQVLYLVDESGATASLRSVRTDGTELSSVDLATSAHVGSISLSADGSQIYLTYPADDAIRVYNLLASGQVDAASQQILQNGQNGVQGLAGVAAVEASNSHLFAVGKDDDSLLVFEREAAGQLKFVQRLRNGENEVNGLRNPNGLAIAGSRLYVTSDGSVGSAGGIVRFDINPSAAQSANPLQLRYDGMTQVTVTTGAGRDLVSIGDRFKGNNGDAAILTVETGDGADVVTVVQRDDNQTLDVHLGNHADVFSLTVFGSNNHTTIAGGAGADTVNVKRIGPSNTAIVELGGGGDVTRVNGTALQSELTIDGQAPTANPNGDTLRFDTKSKPHTQVTSAVGAGRIKLNDNQFGVTYIGIENTELLNLQTNTSPTIGAVDVDAAITEGTANVLVDTGSVTFNDADAADLSTVSVALRSVTTNSLTKVPAELTQKLADALKLSGAGVDSAIHDGTVDWEFRLLNRLVNYLWIGETLTAVYTIAVTDDSGFDNDTTTQDVTIVITGAVSDDEFRNDFGDAPTPYPTTLAENGARHTRGTLILGGNVDTEGDGTHSSNADGDGTDEDGVAFGTIQVGALAAEVIVNVQGEGGLLDAWIDFNGDGSWGGPGEQIFTARPVSAGENRLSFDVSSFAVAGTTYARFRLSDVGGLGVTGAANNGEVEDYQFTILNPEAASGFTLNERQVIATPDGAKSVFAADMDNDGDMDIVSAAFYADRIEWLENVGGNFVSHAIDTGLADLSPYTDGASSVFAVDMDGDGNMDVVSSFRRAGRIHWYKNDGQQNFTRQTVDAAALGASSVFAMDMDNDGDIDILASLQTGDAIVWYENNGNEAFSKQTINASATGATSVFAVDVDSDGDMDVLSASRGNNSVIWYENDGGQAFSLHVINDRAVGAASVFATDVDGDGDIDVLSASRGDNKIVWYENNGSELFTPRTISDDAVGASSVFAADVDGDGDMDVLATAFDGDSVVWYENVAGQFSAVRTIDDDARGASSVFAADMDGDGDLDVLSASFDADRIAWYVNQQVVLRGASGEGTSEGEDGQPPANSLGFLPESWQNIVAADIDGDGDMDAVSQSSLGDALAWFENFGGLLFIPHPISGGVTGASALFAADLDGDGDVDLLSASAGDEPMIWYENDGNQTFVPHAVTTTPSTKGQKNVFATDMDRDGDIDILYVSSGDSTIAWYENNGQQVYTSHIISTTAHLTNSVVAADVDGDGDMDVLSAASGDDTFSWFENNGDQSFIAHSISNRQTGPAILFGTDLGPLGISTLYEDDMIAWYKADGSRIVFPGMETITAFGVANGFAADLNRDGVIDLFSASSNGEPVDWTGLGTTWHNFVIAVDANFDGSVSPIDALVIINYLNENGPGSLPVPRPTALVYNFYDTNGDGFVSPVDVLVVFNSLNSTTVVAEGEATVLSTEASHSPLNHDSVRIVPNRRQLAPVPKRADEYFGNGFESAQQIRSNAAYIKQRDATPRTELEESIDELLKPCSMTEIDDVFAAWSQQ